MFQLDLFGEEAAKPKQPKKKGYQLVKPSVLTVAEAATVAEIEAAPSSTEKEEQVIEAFADAVAMNPAAVNPAVVGPIDVALIADAGADVAVEDSPEPSAETEKTETGKKARTRIPMDIGRLNPSSEKINVPEDEILFSKQYYPIGEVAAMFSVNISLIRFWEKEFDILQPRKTGKGDRLFRPEDVKNLKMIFFLLKEKKYTIEGAKVLLKNGKKATHEFETVETLKNIKKMLIVLKSSL